MTNLLAVVIHMILIAIVVVTCFFAYIRDRHKQVTKYLTRLCLLAIAWQIMATLHYFVGSEALALWITDAKLAIVAFAPVQLLLLSIKFFSAIPSRKLKQVFGLLCIIPTITAILSVLSPLHGLMRTELYFTQLEPLRVLHVVNGLWFWIHSAFSYMVILASIFIILYNHSKLPRGYRIPSLLVAIGSIVALFSNFLLFFTPNTQTIDTTLVGLTLAMVFTYAGIAISDESSLLVQAFDNIFSYLEDYIFILNKKRSVIEINPAARRWLASLEITEDIISFDWLLHELGIDSKVALLDGEDSEDERDFHLTIGQQISHYSFNERQITDQSGRVIGTFALFTDITRYKLLIERIEQTAGIDRLTGLGNRYGYERALEDLGGLSYLPLSIVLGDVNGLKAVNDTIGHTAGDALLREIAHILSEACPESSSAYRIGGDEFVLLLPCTTAAGAELVIASIRDSIKRRNSENPPYNVSIALGTATKETEGQDLFECIALADKDMYRNKQNDRRGNS